MLETLYNELKDLRTRWDEAESKDDKDLQREISAEYEAFKEKVIDEGVTSIFWDYAQSRDRGNDCLDFGTDAFHKDFIPSLLLALETANIKKFTFSSAWSGANEEAYEFYKAGWKISGMTLVNTTKEPFKTSYNQTPAFIFTHD